MVKLPIIIAEISLRTFSKNNQEIFIEYLLRLFLNTFLIILPKLIIYNLFIKHSTQNNSKSHTPQPLKTDLFSSVLYQIASYPLLNRSDHTLVPSLIFLLL